MGFAGQVSPPAWRRRSIVWLSSTWAWPLEPSQKQVIQILVKLVIEVGLLACMRLLPVRSAVVCRRACCLGCARGQLKVQA